MSALQDIEVLLDDRPGALAELGEVLGAAGVSLEGGGVFSHSGIATAHFLVADADRAQAALDAAHIGPVTVSEVVLLRLDQGAPGQLGKVARLMADAGVNLRTQYSDHDNQLVLVPHPADHRPCAAAAARWGRDPGLG